MEPGGKKYWFPAKKYGWGWGPPTCWQGWAVMGIWFVFTVLGARLLPNVTAFVIHTFVLVAVLIMVCYMKGEPPRWRWGK
jgi:hypothetical protein